MRDFMTDIAKITGRKFGCSAIFVTLSLSLSLVESILFLINTIGLSSKVREALCCVMPKFV